MNIPKPIRYLFRSRDKPVNSIGGGMSFMFGGTSAGQYVNERTAMQSAAVYACVKILSESIASLPLHVYRNKPDGDRIRAPDHPLYRLLHDAPNDEMSSFTFRETLMTHLLLYGNGFAQIIRNGRGYVTALYPLLPNRMEVSRASNGELIYTYTPDWDEAKGRGVATVSLRKEDVLHVTGLSLDGIMGIAPIQIAKNAIGTELAVEDYGAQFFANDARPSGVLEYAKPIRDAEPLRQSWQAQFSGKGKHSIAVLADGLQYKPISIPPEQAQFLETRKFQLNEIARIFRIPPSMIGDMERATFSNAEQMSLDFVKYTLTPWIARWEQALQQRLILSGERDDIFIRFNVEGLLRGSYKERMEGYAVARQNGWMSANDIRVLENMNRIPKEEGGDLYIINGSTTKLQDAGAFAHKGNNETEGSSE